MENWKDIERYEGIYQISDHGRVKSLKRKVRSKGDGLRELPEKIVQPLYTKAGYLNLIASKNQKRETLVIHHLVAKHFIGERPKGLVIDHIDGNITNNHVSNLRYVTTKQNLRKRRDVKLNEEIAEEIRSLNGVISQSVIANKYKISQSMVSKICSSKAWVNG